MLPMAAEALAEGMALGGASSVMRADSMHLAAAHPLPGAWGLRGGRGLAAARALSRTFRRCLHPMMVHASVDTPRTPHLGAGHPLLATSSMPEAPLLAALDGAGLRAARSISESGGGDAGRQGKAAAAGGAAAQQAA